MAFASRHPGALTAFVLQMIHQRMSAGRVAPSSQFRGASVSQWALSHAGVT